MLPPALTEYRESRGWRYFAAAPPASFAGQRCQLGRSSICSWGSFVSLWGKQSKNIGGGGLSLGAAAVLALQFFPRDLDMADRFVPADFEKSMGT